MPASITVQLGVNEVANVIKQLKIQEQQQLLAHLLKFLRPDMEELAWLKLSESAFEFWDNEEDAIYDQL